MHRLYQLAVRLSDLINVQILGFNRMNPMFVMNLEKQMNSRDTSSERHSLIEDIMRNGLLLAVQKKRRTVEKRLIRRFGVEGYEDTSRMIRPKHNVIVCDQCGHYHELHTICGHCYERVKEESNLILEQIKKCFVYSEPIEEEVRIRYKNESQSDDSGSEVKRRRVVEMDRQRPEWFSDNLLSKSVGNKWVERNPIVREEEPKVLTKD